MITHDMVPQLVGRQVYDRHGRKLGQVCRVYADDVDGTPLWATVTAGLFGMSESYVPLDRADYRNREVRIAVSRDAVRDAPRLARTGDHLEPEQQTLLRRHYGRWLGGSGLSAAAGTAGRLDWAQPTDAMQRVLMQTGMMTPTDPRRSERTGRRRKGHHRAGRAGAPVITAAQSPAAPFPDVLLPAPRDELPEEAPVAAVAVLYAIRPVSGPRISGPPPVEQTDAVERVRLGRAVAEAAPVTGIRPEEPARDSTDSTDSTDSAESPRSTEEADSRVPTG